MRRARDGVKHAGQRALACALVLGSACGLELASRAPTTVEARPAARSEAQDLNAVMSAFVYHLAARHVKWPDSANRDKTSAFVIGVYGKDPITPALAEFCRGRKSGDHPIEVRAVEDAGGIAACHILFVPEEHESGLAAIREACAGRPILVVGASEDSVRKGAHIGFFLERSKVRFAADPEPARKVGLEISSEFLKLARVVEKKAGGPP